jgi:hypothetical protein
VADGIILLVDDDANFAELTRAVLLQGRELRTKCCSPTRA